MPTYINPIDEKTILCKTCQHYCGMHSNWQLECWEDNCDCKQYRDE